MVFILVLGALLLISSLSVWVIQWNEDSVEYSSIVKGVAFIICIVSLGVFLFLVISWTTNHIGANAKVAEYEITKLTIELLREGEATDAEHIVVSQQVIEVNKALASYKYWKETIIGDIIPDKLAELEYLK